MKATLTVLSVRTSSSVLLNKLALRNLSTASLSKRKIVCMFGTHTNTHSTYSVRINRGTWSQCWTYLYSICRQSVVCGSSVLCIYRLIETQLAEPCFKWHVWRLWRAGRVSVIQETITHMYWCICSQLNLPCSPFGFLFFCALYTQSLRNLGRLHDLLCGWWVIESIELASNLGQLTLTAN